MSDRDFGRGRGLRAALMLSIVLAAGRAGAQGIEAGDEVVLASPGDVLKVENRVVADGTIHRVYTVGQADGEWLWLEADDVAGWIKADRVVPFDLALGQATDRITAGSPTAEDFLARGLLWADRGRPDLAEADYTQAIDLEPEWRTPWLNRGNLRRDAGRLDEAMTDLARASELAPLDPLPYFSRGLVQLDRGRPKWAWDQFDLALRVDPNHAGARFNRAATALAMGLDGASADAEAYLALAGWYEHLSPYAAILAALDHRRSGRDAQADGLLDAAARQLDPSAWPSPVLDYLRGRRDLASLLDAADTPDRQAEARSYAGLALRFEGKAEEARPLLEWVAENADPRRVPHLLARSALGNPADDPGGADAAAGSGPAG